MEELSAAAAQAAEAQPGEAAEVENGEGAAAAAKKSLSKVEIGERNLAAATAALEVA